MVYVITEFRKKGVTIKRHGGAKSSQCLFWMNPGQLWLSQAVLNLGRLYSGHSSSPFSSLQQRQGEICSVGRRNKGSYILIFLEK